MILVVDDDIVMLSIIESILTSLKLPCCTAMTISDAETQIHGTTPLDAVICDFRLGDASGLDLLMKAKSCAPTIPFVIMSADSITEPGKQYPIQPDFFLEKPFTVESVINALNAIGIASRG